MMMMKIAINTIIGGNYTYQCNNNNSYHEFEHQRGIKKLQQQIMFSQKRTKYQKFALYNLRNGSEKKTRFRLWQL